MSRLDTNASTGMIRNRLGRLAEYMESIENNNVEDFNEYVRGQVEALTARGETSTDLLSHLFRGYLAAKDHKFVKYIEEKQSRYDDGQAFTPEELMDLAEARYAILVDKGEWNKPSPEQEQLLIMKAQLENLKTTNPKTRRSRARTTTDNANDTSTRRREWVAPPTWKKDNVPSDLNERKWFLGRWWMFYTEETGGKCERWVCHDPTKCRGPKPAYRSKRGRDDAQSDEPVIAPVKATDKNGKRVRFDDDKQDRKQKMIKAISAEWNDSSDTDPEEQE